MPVALLRSAVDDLRMHAVVMAEFGPPEVLVAKEVEEPRTAADDCLIDVELVNVTFVETQIRAGRAPRPEMIPALPVIPGNGVGGVVAATGARVVSSTGGSGAYAERVAVPAAGVLPVPGGVSMRDAVALLSDGRTALGLIGRAAIEPGETVLVEAAAGGVGTLLVQLAKQAGATVVAAVGEERKRELARSLGADVVVDYADRGWPDSLGGVDVVFDGVGGAVARAAFEQLGAGGRHCAFGAASGQFASISESEAAARGVTLLRGAVADRDQMAALADEALRRAAAGTLRPVVGQTFQLERAADAHRAIEARETVGKTLLVAQA